MDTTMSAPVPSSSSPPGLLTALPPLLQSLTLLSDSVVTARQSPSYSSTPYLESSASLFAALKRLHRLIGEHVVACKDATGEARGEVDGVHLELQALVYERKHLEEEIRRCREFESEYQSIVLHTLPEFHNAMLASETPIPNTPHELMLARLRFELAERKRFEGEKKELLQRKLKLSKENDEKKAKLDELEKRLDGFVTSAKEIQAKMAAQA